MPDEYIVLQEHTTPKGVKVELVVPAHILDLADQAPNMTHFAWPQVRVTKIDIQINEVKLP